MLLVLFDVDGTLLLSHDPLVGEAMTQVARELGVEVDVSRLAPGETALRQGRELGVPERSLARWCARVGERYVALLADADTGGWHAPDGIENAMPLCAPLCWPKLRMPCVRAPPCPKLPCWPDGCAMRWRAPSGSSA